MIKSSRQLLNGPYGQTVSSDAVSKLQMELRTRVFLCSLEELLSEGRFNSRCEQVQIWFLWIDCYWPGWVQFIVLSPCDQLRVNPHVLQHRLRDRQTERTLVSECFSAQSRRTLTDRWDSWISLLETSSAAAPVIWEKEQLVFTAAISVSVCQTDCSSSTGNQVLKGMDSRSQPWNKTCTLFF